MTTGIEERNRQYRRTAPLPAPKQLQETGMNEEWIECNRELPPDGELVATKLDDAHGCRNEQTLRRRGGLYFLPCDSMYVYYEPTHWHRIDPRGATHERTRWTD